MTAVDQPWTQAQRGARPDELQERQAARGGRQDFPEQRVNVGEGERATSVAAGAILALLGLSRRSIPGLVVAGVGTAMLHRGLTGHCYAYDALGVDTAQPGPRDGRETEEEI